MAQSVGTRASRSSACNCRFLTPPSNVNVSCKLSPSGNYREGSYTSQRRRRGRTSETSQAIRRRLSYLPPRLVLLLVLAAVLSPFALSASFIIAPSTSQCTFLASRLSGISWKGQVNQVSFRYTTSSASASSSLPAASSLIFRGKTRMRSSPSSSSSLSPMYTGSDQPQQRLVLIGGGHAHVQVIRALKSRPSNIHVTLVDTGESATYSGMVPGCIAGLYDPEETKIHLRPLSRASRIDFVHANASDICLATKRVLCRSPRGSRGDPKHGDDRDPPSSIPFDVLSIDVGSASRGWQAVPGARRFSIPTRPIQRLLASLDEARRKQWEQRVEETPALALASPPASLGQQRTSSDTAADGAPHVVVVGGGAAGLELAFAVAARWRRDFSNLTCTVVHAGSRLLWEEQREANTGKRRRDENILEQVLTEKRIQVMTNCVVEQVHEDHVVVAPLSTKGEDGNCINQESKRFLVPCTHCIWAAGAGPTALGLQLLERQRRDPSQSLDMTEEGWIRVSSTLQSTSHPFVFAVGDCAAICRPRSPADRTDDGAGTCVTIPKAGVYAVRAGPVLIENLTRYMNHQRLAEHSSFRSDPGDEPEVAPLVQYEPQDDFLKLVVCDREEALGFQFGLAMRGAWVWKLKDRIDRTFMDLFRVESAQNSDREGGPASSNREESSATPSSYDTSQYDSSLDSVSSRSLLSPRDAAALLNLEDEGVDYLLARRILRAMTKDIAYQEDVLSWSDRLFNGTRDSVGCQRDRKTQDVTSPWK